MRAQDKTPGDNKALVIGGGMAGIKAALDLAEAGRDVVLIDKAPAIGGLMTQLDRTFPTNNCDLCTLSPHLAESARTLHIDIFPMTELTEIQDEGKGFRAVLKTRPRFIDTEKCTACGDCIKAYPECVRFTPGLDPRAPTCMRYPQATSFSYSIIPERCEDLQGLKETCRAGAINLEDSERVSEMQFGAIVAAPGAELFDPSLLGMYGYGISPNVVTGLEYERILSASGPTLGRLVRPSDGEQPRKIAWIQCAGSRNCREGFLPYCSSACCMYALKETIVTRERFQKDVEAVVFYMDMRTSGKDYELYLKRAVEEFGVRLERSRPHTVELKNGSDDLSITYLPEGESVARKEDFDMVVLSTGFAVSKELRDLGQILGVELNRYGFVKTESFSPVTTSRPGIYVCGLFESPKDIPETMVQASAAACMASGLLDESVPDPAEQAFPPEREVAQEEPRIGVFVCECGDNIGGVIDVPELVRYAGKLPKVAVSRSIGHGCSNESMEEVEREIREKGLNRVVIGACSPRTHEILFQDVLRKAGLNKYLLEMANIRDQVTWVHPDRPLEAQHKAADLIRMAVASVVLAHPLTEHALPMNKDVLVVGGGVAGMNAALALADQGYKIYLVEKTDRLGGLANRIRRTIDGEDVGAYMQDLIERTVRHDNIQVFTRSIIVDHSGMTGFFRTGIQFGPQMFYRRLEHGATIMATGAEPNRPEDYGLGRNEAVVTQLDLESIIEDTPEKVKAWKDVVMIQCVGSRCPENPNCSRVCCQSAIKNALRLLKVNPEIRISILYRDMRVYGFQEDYYREARSRGVLFFRYDQKEMPGAEPAGERIEVHFKDPVLGRTVKIGADCLVLSTGMVVDEEGTEELAMIFRIPRTADGYFMEDHVKLRPVDLPVPGFFVAGTAHSPKDIRESIAQAQAAAGRVKTLLARDVVNLGAAVAKVDGKRCAACLICVRACPFGVPFINADGYSEIDPAKCHGCGVCAAACPAKAIQLMQFEDDQIMAKVEGLFEMVG